MWLTVDFTDLWAYVYIYTHPPPVALAPPVIAMCAIALCKAYVQGDMRGLWCEHHKYNNANDINPLA